MESEDEEQHSFTCKIDNSKIVVDVLQCLYDANKKSNVCLVEACLEALLFVVTNRSKSIQLRVSFPSYMFGEYVINTSLLKWSVSMSLLLDCLQLYGTNSENISSSFHYSLDAMQFQICLEEGGVLTACDMDTICSDDGDPECPAQLFAMFRDRLECGQTIMKADILRDVLHDLLDCVSLSSAVEATSVTLEQSEEALTISFRGSHGINCDVSLPRISPVFVSFRCQRPWRWNYALPAFLAALKPLSTAAEAFLRVNEDGLLILQHQVKVNNGSGSVEGQLVQLFVDCAILAMVPDVYEDLNAAVQ